MITYFLSFLGGRHCRQDDKEKDGKVDDALRKIVEEAELSPTGKKELEKILKGGIWNAATEGDL